MCLLQLVMMLIWLLLVNGASEQELAHRHLMYITVSTGIGGGVIIDNQLLLGSRGLAAELGHVTVIPDGPLCSCGQRGHLEAVSSGPAIARWVEQELKPGHSLFIICKTTNHSKRSLIGCQSG